MKSLSGVRSRIALVAVVVAAPMLGFQVYEASKSRNQAMQRATERVVELARLAVAEEDNSLEEASNLLRILKLVPAISAATPVECNAVLRELTNQHPRIARISVVSSQGKIACTSISAIPLPVDLSDRGWFKEVTEPNAPSIVISKVLISRITGKPVVVVSSPIVGGNSNAVAIYAALGLAWFSDIAARLSQPSGATVAVVDAQSGTILARSSDAARWVGRRFPDSQVMSLFRTQSEGSARVIDFDGVERIIGFRHMPGDLRSHTMVSVGVPVSVVLAEANAQLRWGLAATALMLLTGVSMAWILASFSIIRPLDALGRAARRLGDGDTGIHAELPKLAVDELAQLATVFNQAVAQIADRDMRLEKLALQDALTGLANRRFFDATLAREWQQSLRTGRPLALVMIDVDHFKSYNDWYGHVAGDACLQIVATAIADTVRQSSDTPTRYGGEEFAIILPETDVISALHLAERLMRLITALNVPHLGSSSGRLSVSVGLAAHKPEDEQVGAVSAGMLLHAADSALYKAKKDGRNRVVCHFGTIVQIERGGMKQTV